MKRCPKCRLDYFEDMLGFCLEDGARLVPVANQSGETPTVTKPDQPIQATAKTVNLPFSNIDNPAGLAEPSRIDNLRTTSPNAAEQTILLKEKAANQSLKILQVTPIILSLAHNWWQWLYLNNQYYSSLAGFLLSANFLMWLLLLIAGIAVGLLAVKHNKNKGFAYTSLVILAINLILFLVPKR